MFLPVEPAFPFNNKSTLAQRKYKLVKYGFTSCSFESVELFSVKYLFNM